MKRDALPMSPSRGRSTIAILAPHLVTPIRNGANVYIWNKYAALDVKTWDACLIAADGIYAPDGQGGWRAVRSVAPTTNGRVGAVIGMLGRGLDYLAAKFNTPAYLALCREVDLENCDLVVCSYPSTFLIASKLGLDPGRLLVETHNFDQKVYLDRALELRGPRRLLAGMAAVQAHALLRSVPPWMPLVALGPVDRMLFTAMGFTHVLQGRLGFEVRRPRTRFASNAMPRLLFVGSLSTTMNEMALRDFVSGPLKELRHALGRPLWFGVAGSRPSRGLIEFLAADDIAVHADPSDGELSTLLESCHATVLPFTSNNGLKLKFAHSASHGVPVMSFIEPPEGLEDTPGVLVSGDMRVWAAWLADLSANSALQAFWSRELQTASARNAWPVIVAAEMAELDVRHARRSADERRASSAPMEANAS